MLPSDYHSRDPLEGRHVMDLDAAVVPERSSAVWTVVFVVLAVIALLALLIWMTYQ